MGHGDDITVPNYDQLSLGDLRHRIRLLSEDHLRGLIDHERSHGDRVPVLEVLRARLKELQSGAEPSRGNQSYTPEVAGTPGGSPVQEATAAEPTSPLRHGVASQTPARGRP